MTVFKSLEFGTGHTIVCYIVYAYSNTINLYIIQLYVVFECIQYIHACMYVLSIRILSEAVVTTLYILCTCSLCIDLGLENSDTAMNHESINQHKFKCDFCPAVFSLQVKRSHS